MDRKPINFEEDLILIYELHSYHTSDGSPFFERECLVGKSTEDLIERLAKIGEFSAGLIGNNVGDRRIKMYLFAPFRDKSGKIASDINDVTDLYTQETQKRVKKTRLMSDLKSIQDQIEDLEQKKTKIQQELMLTYK